MARARRLRLRSRLLAAFVGGALLLSAAVALLSYGLTRGYLLTQRETSAQRQAQVNARLVGGALRSATDVPQLLGSLQSPAGSSTVVLHDGRWFAASLDFGREAIPVPLQEAVVERRSRARQRYVINHVPSLAVGLPLPGGDAYFEVFALRELDRTLRTLRVALTVAAGVAMVGAAGLGVWASRRLLDPLADIGATATSIADGQLDARLDVGNEVELAALAASFNQMVDSLQQRIERDLGLALVAEHARLHGGRAWVEDRDDGVGARFIVELPVARCGCPPLPRLGRPGGGGNRRRGLRDPPRPGTDAHTGRCRNAGAGPDGAARPGWPSRPIGAGARRGCVPRPS